MRRQQALEQIERSVGTIAQVGSSVRATRRRAAQAGVDVSAPGMGILGILERGTPQRVSSLARSAGMVAPLVSRELRALEAAGLVERTADGDDGRVVLVSITAAGRAAYQKLRAASVAAAAEALAGWSAAELVGLARLLARVADDFSAGSRRVPAGAGRTTRPARTPSAPRAAAPIERRRGR